MRERARGPAFQAALSLRVPRGTSGAISLAHAAQSASIGFMLFHFLCIVPRVVSRA